ncbi:Hypothetical predicted protein [Podarcis lilfordi]|uniref:Uncharacterized protein n=1 Tax=Podarcis lilfordi TaxID=74358 RepID=A0AA35L5R6_9SAUR|nr:Hypothetical predicted protein [Podarcis lilfordi]
MCYQLSCPPLHSSCCPGKDPAFTGTFYSSTRLEEAHRMGGWVKLASPRRLSFPRDLFSLQSQASFRTEKQRNTDLKLLGSSPSCSPHLNTQGYSFQHSLRTPNSEYI